ncbi:MAG: hypothetical protein MI924_30400 [Chloroflexales bacterium]|nr:hypothetical protein [Chloroflexales bacterium]
MAQSQTAFAPQRRQPFHANRVWLGRTAAFHCWVQRAVSDPAHVVGAAGPSRPRPLRIARRC